MVGISLALARSILDAVPVYADDGRPRRRKHGSASRDPQQQMLKTMAVKRTATPTDTPTAIPTTLELCWPGSEDEEVEVELDVLELVSENRVSTGPDDVDDVEVGLVLSPETKTL